MIRSSLAHLHVAALSHSGMAGKNNEDRYAVASYTVSAEDPLPRGDAPRYTSIEVVDAGDGTAILAPRRPSSEWRMHAAIYAGLAASLALPLSRMSPQRQVLAATLACGLYGVSDEIHQIFTPFRSPEVWDVVADTVGGLIGALVYVAIARRWRSR